MIEFGKNKIDTSFIINSLKRRFAYLLCLLNLNGIFILFALNPHNYFSLLAPFLSFPFPIDAFIVHVYVFFVLKCFFIPTCVIGCRLVAWISIFCLFNFHIFSLCIISFQNGLSIRVLHLLFRNVMKLGDVTNNNEKCK